MLNAALYNIRSLYNVGSIFRTSSGAGFDRLFLAGYTGAPPHRGISKVALGAEEEVPFERFEGLEGLVERLDGHYVIALEQHPNSVLYTEIDPPHDRPVTITVCHEIRGTPPELLERADVIAEIPMAGRKESLNVASAFAIIAYSISLKMGKVGAEELVSHRTTG